MASGAHGAVTEDRGGAAHGLVHRSPARLRQWYGVDVTRNRDVEASAEHERATVRADIASRTTERRYRPQAVANRIVGLEAEIRDRGRRMERADGGPHVEWLAADKASLEDQLAYWQGIRAEQIASGEATNYGP